MSQPKIRQNERYSLIFLKTDFLLLLPPPAKLVPMNQRVNATNPMFLISTQLKNYYKLVSLNLWFILLFASLFEMWLFHQLILGSHSFPMDCENRTCANLELFGTDFMNWGGTAWLELVHRFMIILIVHQNVSHLESDESVSMRVLRFIVDDNNDDYHHLRR